jgi:hypothetical protein
VISWGERRNEMTYRGHVENGVVVLDAPFNLPEGACVEVILTPATEGEEDVSQHPTLYESLREFIGKADDLPPDFAENHDHYIHGTPKQ